MRTPRLKIIYYKRLIDSDTDKYADGKDITDLIDMSNQQGLEIRKDTFTINIPNYRLRTDPEQYSIIRNYNPLTLVNSIHIDDRFEIFAWDPDADELEDTDDAHRIMNGVCTEFKYQITNKGGKFVVSGANVTEVAMRTTVSTVRFHDQDTEFRTPDLKILSLVQEANRMNNTDGDRNHPRHIHAGIGTLDANGDLDAASIAAENYIYPSTRDGTAFPETSYVNKYEPIYKHIETLSGTKYTGDEVSGQYIFYIDKKNAIHWGPKSFSIAGNVTIEEKNFSTWDLQKDAFDVVNVVIVHAGVTPGKSGVTSLAYNTTSLGEYGAKWRFIPTKILSTFLDNERDLGPGLNSGSTLDVVTGFPSSYPWTLQESEIVEDEDGGGYKQNEGTPWVVNSDAEYDEAAKFYGRFEARAYGNDIVQRLGGPTYRLKAALSEGSTSYEIGNLHKVYSKSIGMTEEWESDTRQTTSINLRLFNVSHSFGKAGWQTQLEFKEDEKRFNEGGI